MAEGTNLPTEWAAWADIPTSLLQAELSRRQVDDAAPSSRPVCGGKSRGTYNTGIHVFALILILVLSVAACAFPIVVKRFPRLPVPHKFLFLSRHFGTGVLIATAFVHLFPTAYVSLTDACLAPFWNKGYPAMAGLLAMSSVFIVVGIEMFFAMKGAGHAHGMIELEGISALDDDHSHQMHNRRTSGGIGSRNISGSSRRSMVGRMRPPNIILPENTSTEGLIAARSPSVSNPSPMPDLTVFEPSGRRSKEIEDNDEDEDDDDEMDLDLDELGPDTSANAGLLNGQVKRNSTGSSSSNIHLKVNRNPNRPHQHHNHGQAGHSSLDDELQLENPNQESFHVHPDRKALLQCLLLEAGILFHSVFIGMALSVTPAPAFYVLLVAISFHQTFEGLALGSRISALTFPPRSPHPWLMALAYGTTTPLGQAIGLAIHRMYDPASETGLLSVGIMNAISSGLLLFAGLVELLAVDFLSEESYEMLRGRKRYEACAAVVSGAGLMAFVGAWA